MNSGKLKLVFILIFLLVNIFFVFRITSLSNEKNLFTQEEIVKAVSVLGERGVKIDASTVIPTKNVPLTLKFSYDTNIIELFAKSFMKSGYSTFTIPEGQRFANDNESFTFLYDYTFEYDDFAETIDISFANEALKNVTKGKSEELEGLLNGLFSEISSQEYVFNFNVESFTEKDGYVCVRASQSVNSIPINDTGIVGVIKDDRFVFATGTLYLAESVTDYSVKSHDSINILFELDPMGSKIAKMEYIYQPISDKSNSVYLVPWYKFTLDNSETLYFDAASGTKK